MPHITIHLLHYFKAAEYKIAPSCRNPFWAENGLINKGVVAILTATPKSHYYQIVSTSFQFKLAPQNLSKIGRNKVVNQLNVNSSKTSMALDERRDHERQQRIARARGYQDLLDKNGWSRAELARQLGVSRAWVTTVLKVGK